jgi:hypothetical protein
MRRLSVLVATALVAVAGLAASAQAHVIHHPVRHGEPALQPGRHHPRPRDGRHQVGEGEQGAVSPGGFTSKDVEYLKYVPFEIGTATGARIVGKHLYVTSWRSFSIYDVTDPQNPVLESTTPFGFQFENEDVATNGDILLFSEELGRQLGRRHQAARLRRPRQEEPEEDRRRRRRRRPHDRVPVRLPLDLRLGRLDRRHARPGQPEEVVGRLAQGDGPQGAARTTSRRSSRAWRSPRRSTSPSRSSTSATRSHRRSSRQARTRTRSGSSTRATGRARARTSSS